MAEFDTEITPAIRALISEEESILANVLVSLEKQLQDGAVRYQTESARARTLTSELVRARRDVDKQMLASDEAVSHNLRDRKKEEIDSILKLLERPYFARFVVEDDTDGRPKRIEYRLGVASNSDCRIVDWRKAPISKLFYEYKEGDEYGEEIQGRDRTGRIIMRRKLEIENGILIGITCNHGSFVLHETTWKIASGKHRGARKRGQLPDVLSLITPEQFRLITQDAESAILIQGVAGSGKTTVALYRLAWLLHEDRRGPKIDKTLILMRSPVLKQYIEKALPSLGLDNDRASGRLSLETLDTWFARLAKAVILSRTDSADTADSKNLKLSPSAPPGVVRVLGSLALLKSVERYAADQSLRACGFVEDCLKTGLKITPELLQTVFERTQAQRENPVPLVAWILEMETLIGSTPGEAHAIAAQRISHLKSRLQLFREDVLKVLESPKAILEEDETNLLDVELITGTREFLESHRESGAIHPAEAAVFLRLYQIKRGSLPGNVQGKLDHLMVDESQDLSPMELSIVLSSVGSMDKVTLVGDIAQNVGHHGQWMSWEKLREHWKLGDQLSRFVSLSVSHRSSFPIMRLGDYVLGEERTTSGRPGKAPLWLKCVDENQGVKEIIDWLTKAMERFPDSLTAVVTPTREEARYAYSHLSTALGAPVRLGDEGEFSFDEGVVVTWAEMIKGLEFENVLLWNPSREAYPRGNRSRNMLYVAITRAEDNLAIVSWEPPTALLPDIHSKLVRGIAFDEEEIERQEQEARESKENRVPSGYHGASD